MFYLDHYPPHFHAVYGEYEGIIDIDSLEMVCGELPPRVLSFFLEWSNLHQADLSDNWECARQKRTLEAIAPLV
jgi:hypothetical protein